MEDLLTAVQPIPGPTGATGATGATGPQGPAGTGTGTALALGWYDAKDYGLVADLRQTTVATTSGSTTLTGTFLTSNGDAGKLVQVIGAGTNQTRTDGVISGIGTRQANLLTCAGASFTSAILGQWVTVAGAGGGGGVLSARVWGVVSATQLRLTWNAGTAVNGATVVISADHYSTITASTATTATIANACGTTLSAAQAWKCTDDTAHIQAAIDAAAAVVGVNGATVYIDGQCGITSTINVHDKMISLQGHGSRGYSNLLGHGTSRIRCMAPKMTAYRFGPAASGLGLRGAMTSGSGILTDPDAAFVSGDVGKTIDVIGAGTQTGSATQQSLRTTIASRQSATQVTLTATAATTVTDATYSYASGLNNYNGVAPIRDMHFEGSAGQICGIHMMDANTWQVRDCTVSDFYGGIGLFSDGIGGNNQYMTVADSNFNNCRVGIKGHIDELMLSGTIVIDGMDNQIGIVPGPGTIGIDVFAGIDGRGVFVMQALETGIRSDGHSFGSAVHMSVCRFECVLIAVQLASDASSGGRNGGSGGQITCTAIDSSGIGTSTNNKGLVLKAGAWNTYFNPGWYDPTYIDMYGGSDATSLAHTVRLDNGTGLFTGGAATIIKAGPIGDADFWTQPPDGALAVDTTNKRIQARIGGAWSYASMTGFASRVKQIANNQNQVAGTSTITLSCTGSTIIAGHHVVVAIGYGSASTRTITVTDSKSNSYTTNITADMVTSQTPHAAIAIGRVTTPLVAGDTITVTFSGTTGISDAIAYEYSGLASSSWIDGTSIGATGTSTTPSSGNDVTTNASDLLFSVTYNAAATPTAGSGWTILDTIDNIGAKRITVQEQIVSATGTYAGTCTLNTSVDWATVLVAAKAA